ncbi:MULTISPECIES: ImmA/IrrE family metallo-endopeptidase [Serratia]|uniref:ImmA/IrrE family metallo-endopeptidase n=1 Tax=Serratia TaxID=613 RepID=UPI0027E429BE|nr:ImmA/IrrE family metallo-endopeptidase [Serratia marcescens]MCS3411093.1 ImmA/IrrE family metallo-endopeptidase [Serratia marcescens]
MVPKRELGHRVSPLSNEKIKHYAQQLRDALELNNSRYMRLDVLLEGLAATDSIMLEIVEDRELQGRYALTYPDRNKIVLRQSVYDGLCEGEHHSRFTVAHELGHLIMHRNQMAYARSSTAGKHKIYEDSEWQADVFASHFLIDSRLVEPGSTAEKISHDFGVSLSAATTWLRKNR